MFLRHWFGYDPFLCLKEFKRLEKEHLKVLNMKFSLFTGYLLS